MTDELRHYVVFWFDAQAQRYAYATIRAADMHDAVALFEREGDELSGFQWRKGERFRIRAIAKDDCPACGGGGGSVLLVPGQTCSVCEGTGKRKA